MRQLDIGSDRFTKIIVLDDPGAGNACHEYAVCPASLDMTEAYEDIFARVNFQKGPIKENGINGCHQEDLLAIVIDRLQCFQAGEFACDDNQEAMEHIEKAMACLNRRTKDRINRGVEGTSEK